MVFFFTVSGGAYGLELVVSASGPGMALLLILVTPLVWSLPIALLSAELSAAIPDEGGYYVWVKRALGPFWGFLEGWWSWLSSFPLMAVHPVLFAEYLSALLSEQFGVSFLADNAWARWLVAVAMILALAWLNLRGARAVGASSIWFGVFILAPFAVMSLLGLLRLIQSPTPIWQPLVPPETGLLGAFGIGLFILMWNYAGWDAVSTINGEVEHPQRNVPLAIAITIPLIVLTYFLPVLAGLAGGLPWADWSLGTFPLVATALGGAWLGLWLAVGALVSRLGLFNAQLLSISRLPFVLAEDGYLPRAITREHKRFGTPWVSIAVCAVIYILFSLDAFASLIVTCMVLYSAALILECLALIALRLKEPNLPRPVRVPGGLAGAVLITLLPTAVLLLAIVATVQEVGPQMLYLSAVAVVSGPLAYPLLRALMKRLQPAAPLGR